MLNKKIEIQSSQRAQSTQRSNQELRELNALSSKIIGLAIEVHRTLGPGLLESAYQQCLAYEFRRHNIKFILEPQAPVTYKGVTIDCGFRPDMIVENSVIVELKSVEKILSIHEAQLLTYLKISGMRLGLLINFNSKLLKNGITRIIV